jgi:N-acetylneuraminic acid mutarotase
MKNLSRFRTFTATTLIALGATCAFEAFSLASPRPASVSFEDRVAYQRRIEEVYWRHRSSTQAPEQPVTPFAEAMPDAALREKVEDSLRKSAALERYWRRPVTADQLKAEVARMASQSRQPEVLRELFAALDNNPSIIAECLARPILVERELRSWYARDTRFHGALRQQIEPELQDPGHASLKSLSGEYSEREFSRQPRSGRSSIGEGVNPIPVSATEWQATMDQLAAAFVDGHSNSFLSDPFISAAQTAKTVSAVPTAQISFLQENENEFYVVSVLEQSAERMKVATVHWPKEPLDVWWQKVRGEISPVDPASVGETSFDLPDIAAPLGEDDTWQPTNAPLTARENHTAVWTGSEMIVWGGFYNPSNYSDYAVTVGSRYNPATDSWTLTSTLNAPAWRERHTAVWTGTEMIVWGGYAGGNGVTNTGARYNPTTNTWSALSTVGAPAKRSRHGAVWTGSRMLVFGGRTGDTDNTTVNTGGSYDPASDTWTALSTSNAPAPREYFSTIWSGSEMIVWGGYDGTKSIGVNTGGRYNPQTNTWQSTSTSTPLTPRYGHQAVWTGTRMLVFGGQGPDFVNYGFFNTGASYDPVSNTWSAISTTSAPSPRSAMAAIWSGTEMLIWGGNDLQDRLVNGGRYNPQSNTWQSLSTVGAPQNSVLMSVVWTGTEMIVWGGQEPTLAADINTGARYRPSDNTWLPVTNPQTGGPRNEHPAVWTGAEMVVWGSYTSFTSPTNTGARYYPSSDSWLPTSMVNVPKYRYAPQAVWTGTQMVVWGGCSDSFCFTRLNTGGRYNPASNSWQPTSTVNAAEARYWFSTVWTGSEMIVWGGCDAQTCGPGGSSDRLGLNNGGRYNPQTDSWTATTTMGAPTSRWNQSAVWSGNEMIVWGGLNGNGQFNTGGRYNPASDTWTATATTGAPMARDLARSVWTGTRMIVWGGYNSGSDQYLNTGGLYDPVGNTWTATSVTGAPSGRSGHTLVWTGSEMIAWGGCNGANCQQGQNTGGRYDPQANSWVTTSTIEAPSPRDSHSAVWTGTEMIVFGGEPCARCEPIYDTGGRYTAATGSVVDTVTITRAQYATERRQLVVRATDSDPNAILTVSVTSTGVILGDMINLGGGSYSAKFSRIDNPVNITVKSNLGGNASAAVRVR